MLKRTDIDAAVAEDVLTQDQADALLRFAQERQSARVPESPGEDSFRLLAGFNDFFIAIGVLLLGIGLLYAFGSSWKSSGSILVPAVGLLLMWGLAEYLTGHLRLTAPSIVIVIFLAVFAFSAGIGFTTLLEIGGLQRTLGTWSLVPTGLALLAACLHYWRFRFPFTWLVIALCGLALVLALVGFGSKDLLRAARDLPWVAFAFGLVTFAAAMRFDLSDPLRQTRKADSGFWLHLAAAPMIVHPLATNLRASDSGDGALWIVALSVVLTCIALLIDRRALVVAALSYLGGAIAYGLSQVASGRTTSVLLTLVFLGVMIIALGTGWQRLRAGVMRCLPDHPFKSKLPPYDQAT